MTAAKKATKAKRATSMSAKKAPTKSVGKASATVLGHSVTSVAKALGKLGWENDKAKAAIAKLVKGDVQPASISTALADGRNPKYNTKGVAELSKDELAKLRAAAK